MAGGWNANSAERPVMEGDPPPMPVEHAVTGTEPIVPLQVRCSRLFAMKRESVHSLAMTSVRSGSPGRRT